MRSRRCANPWKVPSHMAPLGNPNSVSMRLRISAPALLVKETERRNTAQNADQYGQGRNSCTARDEDGATHIVERPQQTPPDQDEATGAPVLVDKQPNDGWYPHEGRAAHRQQ